MAGGIDDESAVTAQLTAVRSHCAGCGVAMAPDQRYCVECGQRRGAVQAPFAAQPMRMVAEPRVSRLSRLSPNTTLLAGIATLMLAMGVGVLIGRSAGGNAKGGGYQVLSLPSTVGAAAPGTATTPNAATGGEAESEAAQEEEEEAESGAGSKAKKAGSKSKASKSAAGSGAESEGAGETGKAQSSHGVAKPEKPVVEVGSSGKGRGYQKGKFTGHFFGGE